MIVPIPLRFLCHAMMSALCAIMVCVAVAHAQVPTPVLMPGTGGVRYRIAFPDTVTNTLDTRYPNNRVRNESSLWIFSPVKNKVKITNSSGASTVLNLDAGKFKVYTPSGATAVDVYNSPVRRTFLVEADQPIVLYCYFASVQGAEAWAPAPTDRWGKKFQAASIPGEAVNDIGIAGETEVPSVPKPAPALILVIADRDSTIVTLRLAPKVGLYGNPPTTVMLNEGEAYQFVSIVDTTPGADSQEDIGGTVIQSNKPIGVVTGNCRAQAVFDQAGLKNNAYKGPMFEWVPPIEQLGRNFVFLPSWDNHRPGIGAIGERLREFVRVYNYRDAELGGQFLPPGGVTAQDFTVKPDSLREFAFGAAAAVSFRTNAPAMAMMHSSAIVRFNGSTPCFRGIPCFSYSAWVPYMVEMTPREQWTTFAPYYAPTNPGTMQHYVSVVTDTITMKSIVRDNGSPFPFNRKIPGTDLVWGTMGVAAGGDNWLMSTNGKGFGGVVFGMMEGGEEYRPGAARKKDGASAGLAGGGQGGPEAQHPCEYEEYNGLAYGYPLAPGRRVLYLVDTLRIDTLSRPCGELTILAEFQDSDASGFSSIRLDPTTSINAKLIMVSPLAINDIVGRTSVTVRVVPIDPLKAAQATVLIESAAGQSWSVSTSYRPDHLDLDFPALLEFGSVPADSIVTRTVTIHNTADHPIVITSIDAVGGTSGFTVDPLALPLQIAPGASIQVGIRFSPKAGTRDYALSLTLLLGCGQRSISITGHLFVPTTGVDEVAAGRFGLDAALRGQRLVVQASAPEGSRVGITVFDALGTVVATVHEGYLSGAIQTFEVDASALPSGVYYCRMRDGQRERIQSIVVVH